MVKVWSSSVCSRLPPSRPLVLRRAHTSGRGAQGRHGGCGGRAEAWLCATLADAVGGSRGDADPWLTAVLAHAGERAGGGVDFGCPGLKVAPLVAQDVADALHN